jgi:PPM family protein phosphatase
MKVAAKSDVGRLRNNNEDCLFVDEALGLLLVADGMGGRAGGEVASARAVEVIATYVKRHLAGCLPEGQTAALLSAAIRSADVAIRAAAQARRKLRDMGTTVVLALCQAEQVHIAHVGDSRAYLLHHGELHQLTEDHSVATQLLRAGAITPRQARTHPLRHQLSRSLGSGDAVAELLGVTWQPGDHLLLCSDGLTNMVRDGRIQELILQAHIDVQAACEALVARANARGGKENISVILAYRDA